MAKPTYDDQNIFAKILRGEIPNKTVFENDHVLAFEDIQPQAKYHILIIPKNAYTDIQDFLENASDAEKLAYFDAVKEIAKQLEIDETGYRLIANCRAHSRQDVPHLHFHMLGGEQLPRLEAK